MQTSRSKKNPVLLLSPRFSDWLAAVDACIALTTSMPHSPRLYGGRLWLLNSGTGELGVIDRAAGAFTPVCLCPGYARGLAFIGRHAVIGLSRPRRNQTFAGLALDRRLADKDATRPAAAC